MRKNHRLAGTNTSSLLPTVYSRYLCNLLFFTSSYQPHLLHCAHSYLAFYWKLEKHTSSALCVFFDAYTVERTFCEEQNFRDFPSLLSSWFGILFLLYLQSLVRAGNSICHTPRWWSLAKLCRPILNHSQPPTISEVLFYLHPTYYIGDNFFLRLCSVWHLRNQFCSSQKAIRQENMPATEDAIPLKSSEDKTPGKKLIGSGVS